LAANKRKILETARKHAQKGAKEKALKEFGKLLKLDPRDSKVRLEMGDTFRRWGQVPEAIEAYSNVADQFMQEGFDARAVAVFKQIQNLQPGSFSYHEPLAELYQRMGLTAEAISCLETAAESYREAGQKQEALGLLRKMAAIDPSNTTSRIKVADLLQQEGMKEDAISEYDAVVAELDLQGDTESVAKLFERILEIDPERVETLVLYARNLIDRNSAQRAESLAKRALEVDRSPEHFELLADVYRMEKREEELVSLYRELAEVYRERGDEDRTREILQRHVPLDEIGSTTGPNGYIEDGENLNEEDDLVDDLSIGDETTLLDGDLLSDPTLLVSDDDSQIGMPGPDADLDVLKSDPPDQVSDSNEMTTLLPDEPSEGTSSGRQEGADAGIDDSQLLVEASVYLRYGKRSQAIANLESILERDANHRLALEKLGEALAEGDDSAKAVEMWSRAAKLAAESGEGDAAEVLRSRIAGLDSEAAKALDLPVASASEIDVDDPLITDDLIGEDNDDLSLSDVLIDDAGADLSASDDLIDGAGADLSASDDLIDDAGADLSASDDLIDDAGDDLSISDDLGDDVSDDDLSISDDLDDDVSDDALAIEDDLSTPQSGDASSEIKGADLPELDLAEVSISDMEIEIEIDDASFGMDSSDEEESSESEEEVAVADSPKVEDADIDELNIDDLSLADGADDGEPDTEDESADAEPSTATEAGGSDVSPEKIAEDLEEADFFREQGLLEEAEAAYSKILEIAPNHPEAMVRLGELAAQRGDDSESVSESTDPEAEIAASTDSAPEDLATDEIGADLADWGGDLPENEAQEENEESDASDSDALTLDGSADLDPASEVEGVDAASAEEQDETGELPDVPAEPAISADSRESEEVDEPEATESEQAEPESALESPVQDVAQTSDGTGESVEDGDDLGFDLAAELSESLDQDPGASASGSTGAPGRGGTSGDGFASVFAEFKKGVSETLNEGDHQAHYDLGIAYREMGLLTDAFSEFQLAMELPERRVGCLQLMGMCAHEMGEPEQAVGHYTEALASEGASEDTVLAITLDLGKAHEAAGDVASARSAYEEIQAINPKYADVAARLDELEKSVEAEPEDDGSASTEEYESFAEFLEDDDDSDDATPDAAADSTGGAEEEPVWETFDDVVAEIEGADNADSSSASEADDSESAGAEESDDSTPKRRKKKISFV